MWKVWICHWGHQCSWEPQAHAFMQRSCSALLRGDTSLASEWAVGVLVQCHAWTPDPGRPPSVHGDLALDLRLSSCAMLCAWASPEGAWERRSPARLSCLWPWSCLKGSPLAWMCLWEIAQSEGERQRGIFVKKLCFWVLALFWERLGYCKMLMLLQG